MMNEKRYLRTIRRQLRCGREKKREIMKQIQSDIFAGREEGERLDVLFSELGSPAEIVQAFNENMTDADIKKAKQEKLIKILLSVFAVFMLFFLMLSWILPHWSNGIEDSKYFQTEDVIARAEEIIGYLNVDDYEALKPLMSDKMQDETLMEVLRETKVQLLESAGEYRGISENTTRIAGLWQMGKHYAVVWISVLYENTGITYQLSFGTDMKLEGLYMR